MSTMVRPLIAIIDGKLLVLGALGAVIMLGHAAMGALPAAPTSVPAGLQPGDSAGGLSVGGAAGKRILSQDGGFGGGGGKGNGTGDGKSSGPPALHITVDTPTDITSNSQAPANSLLAGSRVIYYGKVPASDIDNVCSMIVDGQRSFPAAVTTSSGNTQDYTFDLMATGGCGTDASESVFTISSGNAPPGTRVAVVCGNNAPPGVCFIYYTNDQANSGARRRRLQDNANCPGCLEACNCQNVNENCFPGSARAEVQGRGTVPMKDLLVGDRVLTINSRGSAVYEPVYMFGHRDAATLLPVIELSVSGGAGGPAAKLSLSARHFIPVAANATAAAVNAYAQDLQPGDVVTMMAAGNLSVGTVIAKRAMLEQGAFNPYTRGGYMVVDGVLVSCHSDWFLDASVQRFAPHLTHLLPAAYQVVLKPFYFLYILLGERAADRLNNALLAGWINRLTLGQVASGVGMSIVSTAAAGSSVI